MSVALLPIRSWISLSAAATSSLSRACSRSTGLAPASCTPRDACVTIMSLAAGHRPVRHLGICRCHGQADREVIERGRWFRSMRDVLKTNNPVLLNFAEALLADAGIQAVVFDTHMSIMDGSLGVF